MTFNLVTAFQYFNKGMVHERNIDNTDSLILKISKKWTREGNNKTQTRRKYLPLMYLIKI